MPSTPTRSNEECRALSRGSTCVGLLDHPVRLDKPVLGIETEKNAGTVRIPPRRYLVPQLSNRSLDIADLNSDRQVCGPIGIRPAVLLKHGLDGSALGVSIQAHRARHGPAARYDDRTHDDQQHRHGSSQPTESTRRNAHRRPHATGFGRGRHTSSLPCVEPQSRPDPGGQEHVAALDYPRSSLLGAQDLDRVDARGAARRQPGGDAGGGDENSGGAEQADGIERLDLEQQAAQHASHRECQG